MPQSNDQLAFASNGEPRRGRRVKSRPTQRDEVRRLLAAASAKLLSSPLEAVPLAESARLESRILGDLALQGEAALSLAMCHSKLGELDRANELIAQSLEAFERAGGHHSLGRVYKLQTMVFSSQDRVSLALAAAGKALAYSALLQKDRAMLFAISASCLYRLSDLQSGLAAMEERALPEADRSGDPSTIVGCYVRAAMLLTIFACWSAGVPNMHTVGMTPPADIGKPAEYLAKASRYLLLCEAQGEVLPVTASAALLFGCKACVATLRGDFDGAKAIYAQARSSLDDRFPRSRVELLIWEGNDAVVAGHWQYALELLCEAQLHPIAQLGSNQRSIQFNLSRTYRALGRSDEALQALERFTQLQSNVARLATSWINDKNGQRRYGEKLDLDRLRTAVLHPAEPVALTLAAQYVENNLDRRLMLSEVARQAGVSARTLLTMFKSFRGMSASAFIRECRLQRARQVLHEAKLSVLQVSDAIGYSNPANFARDFRRRFGYAPSDVQRSEERQRRVNPSLRRTTS